MLFKKTMEMGAALAISISGGKDSDALLRHLAAIHQAQQWSGELFAITAELGRIEWPGTIEHIRDVCNELSIKLVVVRRQKGGMIERWDERRQVLIKQQETKRAIAHPTEGDKPFWSSSATRYCTKELKTAEVDRYLRQLKAVACAVGIRAEESHSRAKKPHYQVRNDITTAALKASRGMTAEQHEAWASDAIAQWVKSDYKAGIDGDTKWLELPARKLVEHVGYRTVRATTGHKASTHAPVSSGAVTTLGSTVRDRTFIESTAAHSHVLDRGHPYSPGHSSQTTEKYTSEIALNLNEKAPAQSTRWLNTHLYLYSINSIFPIYTRFYTQIHQLIQDCLKYTCKMCIVKSAGNDMAHSSVFGTGANQPQSNVLGTSSRPHKV